MKFLILFAFVAFVATMDNDHKKIYKDWKNHVEKYNRKYHNDDHARKGFENFARNYAMVQEHNKRFESGHVTFKIGLNKFSDMSQEEKQSYGGLIKDRNPPSRSPRYISATYTSMNGIKFEEISANKILPAIVDYTRFAGQVRNQGQCASCYSFAVNKAIEMNLRYKYGLSYNLAPQLPIDCGYAVGTYGCDGGSQLNTMDFYVKNGKCLLQESQNPYQAAVHEKTQAQCKTMCASSTINAKVSSYSTAKYDDWGAVKTLLTAGPCVIGIYASPKFYYYESGLYDDPVDYGGPNHMVVAVGYGKISGVEYIKILNSWGEDWGDHGFAYIKPGQLRILTDMTYPNVTLIS